MEQTMIATRLAEFVNELSFNDLPAEAINESKRVILDSIGCALAGATHTKGKIGLQFGRRFGGCPEARVIGFGDKLSAMGASFANAELINALDFDAILAPGHVAPYVLPGALATGEMLGSSGRDLILVNAFAHEMTHRIGLAMDNQRNIKDGKLVQLRVAGYSSTIFGAAAAIAKLKGLDQKTMEDVIGIAGSIAPVQSQWAWAQHAPSTTIKYLLAGWLCLGAFTAVGMAELGHRGDRNIFDPEYGFPVFIGTKRWEPEIITMDLGKKWLFPPKQLFKPYPNCRCINLPLDCMIHLIEENDIRPEEIESIKLWTESFLKAPAWETRMIENQTDAQNSVAHALAIAAHRLPVGLSWQDESVVKDPSIMSMMDKVTFEAHPDYVKKMQEDPLARPTRIEIKARGKIFTEERLYPKGSPSPDPATYTTTDELVEKFRLNAERMMIPSKIEKAVDAILNLEEIDDIAKIMELVCL